MNFLTLLPTLFGVLGDLPKVMAVIQVIIKAIGDAEAAGVDGPTKLTNVLNDVETAINDLNPAWTGEFTTIATAVESVVNEFVGVFNAFKTAAPSPIPAIAVTAKAD